MPKKTNPMRRKSPRIPLVKVRFVSPRPFNMLFKVVFKYKNGQIHARIVMNFPASSLEKTWLPRKFPNVKKNSRQPNPRNIQKEKVFLMVYFRDSSSPRACVSETRGRSINEIDPVRALGNKIKGSAIPVRTP